ncbi:cilia- and flagella-associated protein 221 isoform X3 [Pelobates fuscus]|uniref:cilia- and flagella-associated protein 221 isoform X3 n=1 Tax=Pelobates fuscus TaxID=191477 RepID=UPI002FE48B10
MELVQASLLDFPNADQRFKRIPPIVLDSLVEEPPKQAVPNHLLESKVYTRLGRNEIVQASPAVLHFGGYETGKQHHQTLKLINISQEVTNFHIIPPQTKHFAITYNKTQLVPGLAFTVNVFFSPDEWRYYYDSVRVHCKDNETLLVPLHGYPAMNDVHFPSTINFSSVPLGQSKKHVIPLRCSCPIDFEFRIVWTQFTEAFSVSPKSGMIPANGQVDVTVTYSPRDYGTAQMQMELLVSEFNAKPHKCTFTGICNPHLSKTKEDSEPVSSLGRMAAAGKGLPVLSRKKRQLQTLQQNASTVIEYQNLRFPIHLSNPYSVAIVLNQQPGRLRARDLRDALTNDKGSRRQAKEALFEQRVQHNVSEEEANQLKWQVCLGREPISAKMRQTINKERHSAETEYKIKSGISAPETECKREMLMIGSQRILRPVDQCYSVQPQFDLHVNNLWADRHRALKRFQQAARKVLLRCRIIRKLFLLKKFIVNVKEKEDEISEDGVQNGDALLLSNNQVSHCEFPYYPAEHEPPTGLQSAAPKPVDVQLKQRLPYYNLTVPQHYRMMGYQPIRACETSSSYKSPALARPLRTGAEDELIPAKESLPAEPLLSGLTEHESRQEGETPRNLFRSLVPPEQMLNPSDYPRMHVFNPAPGLLALKRPLSYSEIDMDYHFCPLPKYPVMQLHVGISAPINTQRRFLSREEILRGTMVWRRFPSIALSAASPSIRAGTPRWCDPFNADLLPLDIPSTLCDLPEEDKENILMKELEEKDMKASLTPNMLKAEFPLIQIEPGDPTTVPEELEAESTAQDNNDRLSDKIRERLTQMKMLSYNRRLILH